MTVYVPVPTLCGLLVGLALHLWCGDGVLGLEF